MSMIPMQKTKCASRVQLLGFAPYLRTWEGRKSQNLELYSICLLAVRPVSVSYRHLPVGWYIRFGILCTVNFGRSSILWNFAGTPFCKFSRNLFFPQKGGLVHQKGGRSLPLWEKRGSRQMYNTKTSRPSFPLVSVRKIPGKYQPIPNRITKLGYNSSKIGLVRF